MNTQAEATHRFVLEAFARTGRSPNLEEIKTKFELDSAGEAEALIVELEQKGSVHRDAGDTRISHAYPFSNEPTPHRVQLDTGVEVYAMCAVDALGIPFMLSRDGQISSVCGQCDGEVHVAVSSNGVASSTPPDVVVWVPVIQVGCVPAADVCPHVNFFCAEAHLDSWRKQQPGHEGESLSLEQAVDRGRAIFGAMLEGGGEVQRT